MPVQAAAAQECAAQNRLSLLEANVQMTNEHDDRLFRMIREQRPDVLLIEEVDDWWNQKLNNLHGEYTYFKHYVTQNYFGVALLSKYPLTSADVHFLADARDPAIFATIKMPSGDEVRLYGIHPRPPQVGQSSAERDAQIMAAALAVRKADDPAILAGDMNAPPWSSVVRRAARIGPMLEPRVGRGWKPSWKAGAAVMRWPLDEVLVTPQFAVAELQVLPPFGSDHQPVLSRLCYAPGNSSARNVPRTDPGDLPAAHAAVIKGQNKAEHSPEPKPGKQEPAP
ncbi:endonuclease/exonuclease/phosphatase family protein [Bradyrhizobium sp. P5_C11_2]